MTSLIQSLTELAGRGEMMDALGGVLGTGRADTERAVGSALPAMLGGLTDQAAESGGSRQVFDLVRSQDDAIIDDPKRMFAGNDLTGGGHLVASVFGDRRAGVERSLGDHTNLGPGTMSKALAAVAPMVMGLLRRRQREDRLDEHGLSRLLSNERTELDRAGHGPLLAMMGGGAAVAGMAGMAGSSSSTTTSSEQISGGRVEEVEVTEVITETTVTETTGGVSGGKIAGGIVAGGAAAATAGAIGRDKLPDAPDVTRVERTVEKVEPQRVERVVEQRPAEKVERVERVAETKPVVEERETVRRVADDRTATRETVVHEEKKRGLGWLWWLLGALLLLALLGLILSQCGGDGDDGAVATDTSAAAVTTEAPATTQAPATTEAPAATATTEAPTTTAAPATTVAAPASTLSNVVADRPELSTIQQAVSLAGLGSALEQDGPITIFAPNNEAFNAMDTSNLTADDLQNTVTYHVVEGNLTAADLETGKLTTLQGGELDVVVDGVAVTINGANVVTADLAASNGTIHVIDQVLTAPAAAGSGATLNEELSLEPITFEVNSATITSEGKAVVDQAYDYLEANADVNVEVGGHTDSDGSDEANQSLSNDRANAVMDYLAGKGIAGDRMTAKGYGEANPVASNDTDDGKAQNRRIEFTKQ